MFAVENTDRQRVLAGAARTAVLQPPGAGAEVPLHGVRVGGQHHGVRVLAAAHTVLAGAVLPRTDPLNSAGVGKLFRTDQARVHGSQRIRMHGQRAVKVLAGMHVKTNLTGGRQQGEGVAGCRLVQAGAGRHDGHVNARLEGKQHAEHVCILCGVRVRQRLQHGPLTGESA